MNQRLRHYWKLGRDAVVPEEERLYAEGRLAFSVPPSLVGRISEAPSVKLTFLQHLRPELSSVDFWLEGPTSCKGNEPAAIAAFARAARHSPPDARTRFVFRDGGGFYTPINTMTVSGYGFQPGIFFSPASGFGLEAGVFDEEMSIPNGASAPRPRLPREACSRDKVFCATRPRCPTTCSKPGRSSSPGFRIFTVWVPHLRLRAFPNCNIRMRTLWLSARRALPFSFYLTVGWKLSTSQVTSSTGDFAALSLPDQNGSHLTRARSPSSASIPVIATGVPQNRLPSCRSRTFPTQGLGSPINFSGVGDEWIQLFSLKYSSKFVRFGLGVRDLQGVAPFSSYSMLNGSIHLPG